jgi:hypothetical protein
LQTCATAFAPGSSWARVAQTTMSSAFPSQTVWRSEVDRLGVALSEAEPMREARSPGQVQGLAPVQAHFGWGMGIGTEGDGDLMLVHQAAERFAGINFAAILAQPGRIEFDSQPFPLRGLEKALEKGCAILPGNEAEFLREIGMADDVEEAGFGRLVQAFEVSGPDVERVVVFPLGKLLRIVDDPGIRDVMDRTDEVVPGMASGEFADPIFVVGQVIDFETEFDGEGGVVALGLVDALDVAIKLVEAHAPVVEAVLTHGRMVGEADLGQADLQGVGGVEGGFARGVAAEGGVHVIIGWPGHEGSVVRIMPNANQKMADNQER